jgi:hypothetical protein
MALSLTQLEEQLEENPTSNSNETHAETNT